MDECIERGWTLADADERPTAKALFEQARERPVLFVFDGLDEALVHLDEAQGKEFTRELLRVRELGEAKGVKNRVLLSCRTHYFRSIKEQDAHFTGQDRGRTIARDYTAIILVPFSQAQIRTYLATAIPDLDVERAIELVASVHNLGQLAERPYTLRLISEQIPAIERIRAQGKAVYGVTLYGLMVEKSPHQARPQAPAHEPPRRLDLGPGDPAGAGDGARGLVCGLVGERSRDAASLRRRQHGQARGGPAHGDLLGPRGRRRGGGGGLSLCPHLHAGVLLVAVFVRRAGR
jgi:hypothetical protein